MQETTNDELAHMIKEGFDDMTDQFQGVNRRLDRIENVILKDHAHRIERLEDALAMPKPARS